MITISSTGQLSATNVQSGSNNSISLTGTAVIVDYINAGNGTGEVMLNASSAGINQQNATPAIEVIAAQLTADAMTGIDLDTQIARADIFAGGTGNIILNNTGVLDLLDVESTDGSISIISNDQLIATAVQTGTDNDISLTAVGIETGLVDAGAGTVTLNANGGSIMDNASGVTADTIVFHNADGIGDSLNYFNTVAATINFSSHIDGDVFITNSHADGISLSGNTASNIIVNETLGSLTINTGSFDSNDHTIQFSTDIGDIILSGSADAGSSDMTLDSAGQISGSGLLTAASLDLTASSGIGSSENEIQAAAPEIIFFNSTSNGSFISNSSASGVTVSSNAANIGEISFIENLGGVILGGELTAPDNTISITSAVDINDDATPTTLTADILNLSANSGIGNITPLIIDASTLDFTSFTNDVEISASPTELSISGNAGSGNIRLTKNSGNLLLNSLVTRADLDLNISGGAIVDANADEVNLIADNVTLISGIGIGSDDAIETSTNSLSFINNSESAVQIVNSSTPSLILQQGSNLGAAISVTQVMAGGSLMINGELVSNDADISLIADNIDLNPPLDPPPDPPLPFGKIDAGEGVVSLSAFSDNQPIIIGGGSATFTDALINNITTSRGLTIGSATHPAEVLIDGDINTSLNITGGIVSLLSDGNISIGGSLTNSVETRMESGNGNILISGNLTGEQDLLLRATLGNIYFRDGFVMTSSSGVIDLFSSGAIAGTGTGDFIAKEGFLTNTAVTMGGDTLVNVENLNLQQNIMTTSGDLTFISTNLTIDPEVKITAAGTVNMPVFQANGELSIRADDSIIFNGAVTTIDSSSDLNIDSGTLEFTVDASLTAVGNVNIITSDIKLDPAALLTVDGQFSLSDQATGNGIGLGKNQPNGELNISNDEYSQIVAGGILLQSSNSIIMDGFTPGTSTVPLTINSSSLQMIGTTRIALDSDLDFSSSLVNVIDGGLSIDVTGSFAMQGEVTAASDVDIHAITGITMAEASSIVTTNNPISLVTDTNDIRLGFLNAGNNQVSLSATTGDILNNNGVFLDVTQSQTNIQASSAILAAQDRIGVSSTDAITLNVDADGSISLDYGADTAYINNLQSSKIKNLGGGTVAVGLIFSEQVLGVGHNLGMNSDMQGTVNVIATEAVDEKDTISILGIDLVALLANNEEDDDFISSIFPSVPVMIRTLDGWQFKSPSRQQILDKSRPGSKGRFRQIDWF